MKKTPDPSTKPYFRCFSCPDFRSKCGGISTRNMNMQEWCECIRDVKAFAHLTNLEIAEKADVSVKTIERVVAISIDQDIRRESARQIELAVFGSSTQFLCRYDHVDTSQLEKILKLEKEVEQWKYENDLKAKIIAKLI